MDVEDINNVEDYEDDDRSEDSHGYLKSDSEADEDEEDEESDSENEDILQPVQNVVRKTSQITYRKGTDRTTLVKLDKYERCSAVIFFAQEIEKGAKVPNIVKRKDIEGVSDTIALAYITVMATLRKSIDEVKTPEQIAQGASIMFRRRLKDDLYDLWSLHELVWFGKLEEEFSDYDLIDSSSIKLGDWFKM